MIRQIWITSTETEEQFLQIQEGSFHSQRGNESQAERYD